MAHIHYITYIGVKYKYNNSIIAEYKPHGTLDAILTIINHVLIETNIVESSIVIIKCN